MLRKLGFRGFLMVSIALAVPAPSTGGANAWTGGRPAGTSALRPVLIASSAAAPDIVYFAQDTGANESVIYRSEDGGRTWTLVASFQEITAICSDPSSPSTLYLGARRPDSSAGIFRSTDRGETWSQGSTPDESPVFTHIAVGEGSSGAMYASTDNVLYKSGDRGLSWEFIRRPAGVTLEIAALLIDPSDETTTYVGGSEYFYGYYYGTYSFFRRTTDGGATWTDLSRGLPGGGSPSVSAVAIDPSHPDTIFAGLEGHTATPVFRSSNGGGFWSPTGAGLPAAADVSSLVMDPRDPRTLYAGTDRGVFRTRDAGSSWHAFGQQLHGYSVDSLLLDAEGRRLRAGTQWGAFELEIGMGAVDIAASPGRSRVLTWDAGRLSVYTLDDSGGESSTPWEGPFGGWAAVAIAGGADGLSRVLWVDGDGEAGLEIEGGTEIQVVHRFPARSGSSAVDVSVGADGTAHILWTNVGGAMLLSSVDSSGAATFGPAYGPYYGWSPVALTDSPDGSTRVLWRKTDGRFSISVHHGLVMGEILRFPAMAARAAEDITVASDGNARVLLVGADDHAVVATVDASGNLTNVQSHSPGLRPRRIAAGPDGLTRLLWSDEAGAADIWLLDPDNSVHSDEAPEPPPPSDGPIAGDWVGTFDSIDWLDCELGTPASATFTQTGSAVEGVLHMTREGCGAENVLFHGTLVGERLQGTLERGGGRSHYTFSLGSTAEGTATGTRMELQLIEKSSFPLPIPGGTMHLHR